MPSLSPIEKRLADVALGKADRMETLRELCGGIVVSLRRSGREREADVLDHTLRLGAPSLPDNTTPVSNEAWQRVKAATGYGSFECDEDVAKAIEGLLRETKIATPYVHALEDFGGAVAEMVGVQIDKHFDAVEGWRDLVNRLREDRRESKDRADSYAKDLTDVQLAIDGGEFDPFSDAQAPRVKLLVEQRDSLAMKVSDCATTMAAIAVAVGGDPALTLLVRVEALVADRKRLTAELDAIAQRAVMPSFLDATSSAVHDDPPYIRHDEAVTYREPNTQEEAAASIEKAWEGYNLMDETPADEALPKAKEPEPELPAPTTEIVRAEVGPRVSIFDQGAAATPTKEKAAQAPAKALPPTDWKPEGDEARVAKINEAQNGLPRVQAAFEAAPKLPAFAARHEDLDLPVLVGMIDGILSVGSPKGLQSRIGERLGTHHLSGNVVDLASWAKAHAEAIRILRPDDKREYRAMLTKAIVEARKGAKVA